MLLFFVPREKAVKTLIALATGTLPKNASSNLIEQAVNVFDNVTEQCLSDTKQFSSYGLDYNYLPQFLIEWVICRAWFLYLTHNVQSSVSMVKDVIVKIQNIIKTNEYQENQ